MRKNKFSKWIERILVCLPLFYIAISSAYVIFNKNAKDSYSDDFIQSVNDITSINEYINNETYYVNNINIGNEMYSIGIIYSSISIDVYDVFGFDTSLDVVGFSMDKYNTTSGGFYTRAYYLDNGVLTASSQYWTGAGRNLLDFTFVSNTSLSTSSTYWKLSGTTQVTNYVLVQNTLNNVMTYSMSEFNNLGFGKLDFTSWFTNIFMNGDTNNVYVSFVNSYINYFLLVECVYFIPMIIYWFIHFGESVVEKFMNKE